MSSNIVASSRVILVIARNGTHAPTATPKRHVRIGRADGGSEETAISLRRIVDERSGRSPRETRAITPPARMDSTDEGGHTDRPSASERPRQGHSAPVGAQRDMTAPQLRPQGDGAGDAVRRFRFSRQTAGRPGTSVALTWRDMTSHCAMYAIAQHALSRLRVTRVLNSLGSTVRSSNRGFRFDLA
jgi:hypothetical protein